MKVLQFWLARAVLTAVVFIVFWVVGWQHWSAVIMAALVAWTVTYFMFGSLYDAAAKQLDGVISKRLGWIDEDANAEDAEAADSGAADSEAEAAKPKPTASAKPQANPKPKASSKPKASPKATPKPKAASKPQSTPARKRAKA